MKRLSLLLWTASIGTMATVSVGTAIALDPDCHAAYKKFIAKIHQPHHLDHKSSKETIRKWTAYNKEMLHKLDIAREVMIDGSETDGLLGSGNTWSGGSISIPPTTDLFPDMPLEEVAISPLGLLANEPYPTYETASVVSLPDNWSSPNGWNGGWPGGYVSVGSTSGESTLSPPITPTALTPEPLPFALVMIGAAFIVVRGRK